MSAAVQRQKDAHAPPRDRPNPQPEHRQTKLWGLPVRPSIKKKIKKLRWEFIKENKKVRKQELDHESDQEKKKNKKEKKNSTKKTTFLVEFLFSCFLL